MLQTKVVEESDTFYATHTLFPKSYGF